MKNGDSRRSLKKLDKMANEVERLEPKYKAMTDSELQSQTEVLKGRLKNGETLDDILCDAFAALREASSRVLGMRHFHVQIIGGICLFQGRIAEMKTGEGKTLVATLPAYLEALSGKGVHIVTVNDYLARRDAEWMGKVHRFMGLTVGVVVPGMDDEAKRAAYKCDITYGTNNEFGFDYLRDNLKSDLKLMVQRELNFAIVDEVDSILIDEARTPLIISGKGEQSSALYEQVDRFVRTLKGGFDDDLKDAEERTGRSRKDREAAGERKLAKAEELNWDYVIQRKEKQVQLTEFGAEKAEKFFNVENIADIANVTLNHHIQQALKAHELFHLNEEYIVKDNEIIIVDEFTGRLMIGRRYSDGLHQAIEAKEGVKVREENKTFATITFQNYFRLYHKLSGMTGTAKTEEGEFRTIYSLDVVEIPTNRPVRRIDMDDKIFSTEEGKKRAIVREIVARHEKGQPILVGTVSVEKSEEISRLLRRNGIQHNILNAKNHEREAEIVAQAGRFNAVTISTNMAGRGTDILLGGNPEYLAKKRLREEGVDHETIELATSYAELDEATQAVRDRYDHLYKTYKAQTDEEKKKVIEAGGLCIIGTERHEARRIDNQLRGRAGRQGDDGVSVFFISLEDDLMKRFGGERMKAIYERSKMEEDECLEASVLSRLVEYAQKQIEGRNFGARKNVLQYDDVMNQQRIIMYGQRMKVLRGENVHEQVLKYIPDYAESTVRAAVNTDVEPSKWNVDDLNRALEQRLLPEGTNYVTQEINRLTDLNMRVTLENYRTIADTIEGTGTDLPETWQPLSSVRLPYNLTPEECREIRSAVIAELRPKFAEQYKFEIGDLRADILAKLPSKKIELERLAKANEAEAARIKADIEAREAAEAARKEKERLEKEAAEKHKAELEKQKSEMAGLFDQAQVQSAYQPKAKVTKKIVITEARAYLNVVNTWWQHEGCRMTADELAKVFKKQVTFCEKLANKEEIFIKAEGLEYVDEVKAK